MTTLERRCRLLLRAYPAAYRQDRGEEIVGTLLEATPAGRSWPLARDIRGLAVGGLRARAALNRRLTTAENLRVAVVAGAAAYLASNASGDLVFGVVHFTHRLGAVPQIGWQLLLVGALVGLAVAVAWVSSRRAVLVTAVFAAVVAVSLTSSWRSVFGWPLAEIACLAALALLVARHERPGYRWLWLVVLASAVPALNVVTPAISLSFLTLLEAGCIVSLLWALIDARLAVAMAVFLLAFWLPLGIFSLLPPFDIGGAVPFFAVIAAAALAIWRLRRQSAGPGARRGS